MKSESLFTRIFEPILVIALILVAFLTVTILYFEQTLPSMKAIKDIHMQVPLRVFSSDGALMAEFGSVRRMPVSLNRVPKEMIEATLATEDSRFFEHSGVDFQGLLRATYVLLTTGKKEQGGSTITMQVARNFFLTRKKSYIRKIREILLAFKIDHALSKKKILELYFNKIFYGKRAYGAEAAAKIYYGKPLNQLTLPQIAMLAGLPKAPSALNPLTNPKGAIERRNHVLWRMFHLHYINFHQYHEATLASISAKYHGLKVSLHTPFVAEMVRQKMLEKYGEKAAYGDGFDVYTTINANLQQDAKSALIKGLFAYDARHGYRGALQNLGDITQLAQKDLLQKLKVIPPAQPLMPAVVLMVNQQTAKVLLKNGQEITLSWQGVKWARKQIMKDDQEYLGAMPKEVNDVLTVGDIIYVESLPNQSWRLAQVPQAQAAIVAMNPHNGAITALVGGFNYDGSKFNRVTDAYRQTGSGFKPFIYTAALAQGYSLATVIDDVPFAISDGGLNGLWRPENDTGKFYGPTRLRIALRKSRNVVSVKLLQLIGVPYALNYVKRFGFDAKKMPKTLSLALGTAQITPLKMAQGFCVFANGGYFVKGHLIDHILNAEGKMVYQSGALTAGNFDQTNPNDNSAPRVISPQLAYLMTSALKDVIVHGTGRTALMLHRTDLAGKTGTTNDRQDGWFNGFNGDLVATAWIGFDQPRPLYEYAVKAALPIWIDFMKLALQGKKEATMPEPKGIVSVRIDPKTGLLAPPNDPDAIFEYFRKDNAPKKMSENFQSKNSSSLNAIY